MLQEAYLRWSATDRDTVAQPRRYLTRVVARLAIDLLRVRQARRENYPGQWLPEPVATDPDATPLAAVDCSDLSYALLHLMERLTPPQRAVYVLHTAFDLPFAQIAPIVERTEADCRQLFRRARLAVAGGHTRFAPSRAEHQRLLADFVAAARGGDLARLQRMLAADAVAYSDGGTRAPSARKPITTPERIARFFAAIYGRPADLSTGPTDLNGAPALIVTTTRGRHALLLHVRDGLIAGIYLVGNPDKLPVPPAAELPTGGKRVEQIP